MQKSDMFSFSRKWTFTLILMAVFSIGFGQESSENNMVRLVKIEVDPDQLDTYVPLLREQMNSAIKLEPGVLQYHVVTEKERPNWFTLIEVYRSREDYLAHLQTPHFLKYKNGTIDMVKSLELLDAKFIAQAMKD
jgi:4-carboxymuconolactone decarboxylase